MSPLVAAMAAPHAPQLVAAPATEDKDQIRQVHEAMRTLGGILAAAQPDALLVIGGDHIEGFFLNAVPALGVFVGRECAGSFSRYDYRYGVHEELARFLVEEGINAGFDLLYSQELRLDYAFFVPLHFIMPEPAIPIVPLFVNVYLPPQPPPWRCYQWGQTIARLLARRPERVAILASGGLSHYPGTARYGNPDFEFDRQLLRQLEAGRGSASARFGAAELDRAGNVETRTWITLLGAVEDRQAEVLTYQPSWHHGYAVVNWPMT
jgi:2,3-dihydroxyphenylpropionate 1,2-dioxygenase